MMPAILSLGFGVIAGLTRYTRAELSEVLTGDYMLLARTKGLTKAQATARHAMRNAMVVILPMIIGEFIGLSYANLVCIKTGNQIIAHQLEKIAEVTIAE